MPAGIQILMKCLSAKQRAVYQAGFGYHQLSPEGSTENSIRKSVYCDAGDAGNGLEASGRPEKRLRQT
jgi:hypothetical protein